MEPHEEKLDIRPLGNAIVRLQEGLARYERDTSDELIRDGLIQRFEFTYELSHRTLKRYLVAASPSPEQFDGMPFQDLIRTANREGLLRGDWPAWRRYRDMRASTSHAYNRQIALDVVAGLANFLEEVLHLQERLRERLA